MEVLSREMRTFLIGKAIKTIMKLGSTRNAGNAIDPLIENHPAKILMIPPEHTEKIRPIYEALQEIKPY